ncbi:hypothetical protein CHRYSEOSP005_13870 [Chryseobacterium sp. Alg-005]
MIKRFKNRVYEFYSQHIMVMKKILFETFLNVIIIKLLLNDIEGGLYNPE